MARVGALRARSTGLGLEEQAPRPHQPQALRSTGAESRKARRAPMTEEREPTTDATSAVQEQGAENGAPKKESNLGVWSYVLYFFGNTPFSLTILTLYFPLWLTEEYGAGPALFNYATAIASLLVVLSAPALGAIVDLHQSRKPYLVVFTLVTVLCTLGLA